jgi:TolB-like protein
LEFQGKIEDDVLNAFADAVRGGAVEGLAACNVKVITHENMMVLLRDMGKSDCTEGDCEVETARNIGADFVVSGSVVNFDNTYVITLKLHETKEGGLLATDSVQAKSRIEIMNQLRGHGRDLVAKNIHPLRTKSGEMLPQVEVATASGNNRQVSKSVIRSDGSRARNEPATGADEYNPAQGVAPTPIPSAPPVTPARKGGAAAHSAASNDVPPYRTGFLFLPSAGLYVPFGDIKYTMGPRIGVLFGGHITDHFSLGTEFVLTFFKSSTDSGSFGDYVFDLVLSPLFQLNVGQVELVIGPRIGPSFGHMESLSAKGIVVGGTLGVFLPRRDLAMGILTVATYGWDVTYGSGWPGSFSLSVALLF